MSFTEKRFFRVIWVIVAVENFGFLAASKLQLEENVVFRIERRMKFVLS